MGGVSNPSVLNVDPSQAIFNAFKLQGREIADTAPTDGQALIWSVVQNKWVPGAGGAGSVSWDDINGRPDLSVYALASALSYLLSADFTWGNLGGRPDLSVYALASALNNYVLVSDLATILGGYVTNSGLSTALNDYLQTSNFTWANLGGRPDLSVYALASALSDYLLSADFTWANLSGKPTPYTRVNPPVEEMTGVVISTTGQNYNLSSIPGTGTHLVHCFIHTGDGGNHSIVFASPDDASKPVPSANANTMPTNIGALNSGSYLFKVMGERFLFAKDGQIWARRGGSSTAGITLEVLGYQEV
jgi:hypothetical protein